MCRITGPLIRIVGDRFPASVKAAILKTFGVLIGKAGIRLKPFLPQLQTTFVKSLQNSDAGVRLKAVRALGQMMPLQTKVDPLLTELGSSLRAPPPADAEDPHGITEAILQAVQVVFATVGAKASSKVIETVTPSVLQMLAHPNDDVRTAAANAAGQCIIWAEDPGLMLQKEILSVGPGAEWTARQGAVLALSAAVSAEQMAEVAAQLAQPITNAINNCVEDARGPVRIAGLTALGSLAAANLRVGTEMAGAQLKRLVIFTGDPDLNIKGAGALKHMCTVRLPNVCYICMRAHT